MSGARPPGREFLAVRMMKSGRQKKERQKQYKSCDDPSPLQRQCLKEDGAESDEVKVFGKGHLRSLAKDTAAILFSVCSSRI